jgi:hypothetical protein
MSGSQGLRFGAVLVVRVGDILHNPDLMKRACKLDQQIGRETPITEAAQDKPVTAQLVFDEGKGQTVTRLMF